jgi:sodium transport system permease protein
MTGEKIIAAVPAARGGGLRRLLRLARKELRESLRDRRTILTLVLMPVLLYPLLGVSFRLFFLSHLGAGSVPEYRIGACTAEELEQLTSYLAQANRPDRDEDVPAGASLSGGKPEPHFRFLKADNPGVLESALHTSEIHVGVRFRRPMQLPIRTDRDLGADLDLFYVEGSPASREALTHLERRLAAANARFLERRLRVLDASQRAVPVRVRALPLADVEQRFAVSLTAVVPLVLILMTITGAVYPAIDLTAGERERGTLEVLVAAPVPRLSLLAAKYLAVLSVAMLTALVNLGMMTVTLEISGLGPQLFGERGLSPLLILEIFALLLLFAAFFAAILLALTSFARSFKEAQAYLIPLMLLSLLPGVLGVMPGMDLSLPFALVPLLNIVLLGRDLFAGKEDALLAAVVVLANLAYAGLAIWIAARVFGAEAVLYREPGSWWSWRRHKNRQECL